MKKGNRKRKRAKWRVIEYRREWEERQRKGERDIQEWRHGRDKEKTMAEITSGKGQKVDEVMRVIPDWLMVMGWNPIRSLSLKDRLPHGEGRTW